MDTTAMLFLILLAIVMDVIVQAFIGVELVKTLTKIADALSQDEKEDKEK